MQPERVYITEVGLRDGFQFEKKVAPTDFKLQLISELVDAGVRHIQVASFVNPAVVPQMADAKELFARLPQNDKVDYSALVLNRKGLLKAIDSGVTSVEISISASRVHGRKNSGMDLEEAISQALGMIKIAKKNHMKIRSGIQCAFGCVYEGKIALDRVFDISRAFLDQGIDILALSDTTGMGNPVRVRRLVGALVAEALPLPVALHFHDTRGLGLVNLMAALECGAVIFDSSLAGMGGCPFVKGAAGNISTEDTVNLFNTLNIESRIDIARVARSSKKVETFFGKQFPGKMHHVLQSGNAIVGC